METPEEITAHQAVVERLIPTIYPAICDIVVEELSGIRQMIGLLDFQRKLSDSEKAVLRQVYDHVLARIRYWNMDRNGSHYD